MGGKALTSLPSRGQIWDVQLNPTTGAEIAKIRPCIVVSNNNVGRLPLRVVVPITKWQDSFRSAMWLVKLEPHAKNGLEKTSAADAFQIRSVSLDRFQHRRGVVSARELDDITAAVGIVIDIQL